MGLVVLDLGRPVVRVFERQNTIFCPSQVPNSHSAVCPGGDQSVKLIGVVADIKTLVKVSRKGLHCPGPQVGDLDFLTHCHRYLLGVVRVKLGTVKPNAGNLL